MTLLSPYAVIQAERIDFSVREKFDNATKRIASRAGYVAKDVSGRLRHRQTAYKGNEVMARISDLKKKLMENPEFRKEYEKVDGEFQLVEELARARTKANLSQAELARKIGTTQSAIARLEGGGVSPSIATLRRYAEVTGAKLEINLVQP
jgi:DNA-binding XRE family transcriptional regulator